MSNLNNGSGMPLSRILLAGITAVLALAVTYVYFGPKTGGPSRFPVGGVVQFGDGSAAKELAGGAVVFESADQKTVARGRIKADGTFELGTFGEKDGALPGDYRILVQGPGPEKFEKTNLAIIDRRFTKFNTSALKATVPLEKNTIVLQVERAPTP